MEVGRLLWHDLARLRNERDGSRRHRIEQEGGSSGKIAALHLGKVLDGFHTRFERPTGDKVVRSNPLASAAEQGRIKLVAGEWVAAYLTELEHFPGGSHDDQVDMSSLGYSKLALKRRATWDDFYPRDGNQAEAAA